jgi:hypothetical protein
VAHTPAPNLLGPCPRCPEPTMASHPNPRSGDKRKRRRHVALRELRHRTTRPPRYRRGDEKPPCKRSTSRYRFPSRPTLRRTPMLAAIRATSKRRKRHRESPGRPRAHCWSGRDPGAKFCSPYRRDQQRAAAGESRGPRVRDSERVAVVCQVSPTRSGPPEESGRRELSGDLFCSGT